MQQPAMRSRAAPKAWVLRKPKLPGRRAVMKIGATAGTVLHIADYGAPYGGNFLASLIRLDEFLKIHTALRVSVVLPARARDRPWVATFREHSIPVTFVEGSRAARQRWRALTALASAERAVLLHTHFTRFDVDAMFVARCTGARVVLHMHSKLIGEYNWKQRIKDFVKIRLLVNRCADRVIPVSESVAADARRRGVATSRLTVIHNGIDTSRIREVSDEVRLSCRSEFSIDTDAFVVLMFGWDPRRKGVDLLSAALNCLPERGERKIEGLIVAEDKYREAIRTTLGECRGTVKLVAPREDVNIFYAAADAFVSASRSEGFPYAVGEAMLAGLPVICSDIPPVAHYKGAGDGVLVFDSGDDRGLAQALDRLSSLDPRQLREQGLQNRRFIADGLTTDHWCRQVSEMYSSVLRGNTCRTPL